MKYMDFFDALREVAGTARRIKYNDGDWNYYCFRKNDQLPYLYQINNMTNETWWPTFEQQKEKAWQIEEIEVKPELSEKLTNDED